MIDLKRDLNFKLARQRRDMADLITSAEKKANPPPVFVPNGLKKKS
jgi:hypothetical protein